jgi:Ca2+-binding EF-hand superfamily protein
MQFFDDNSSYTSENINDSEIKKLEKLFIQKLSEKFKLTDRDLKKAFGQFDTDGSGVLELSELITAIKSKKINKNYFFSLQ